jgi:hypothetical protein
VISENYNKCNLSLIGILRHGDYYDSDEDQHASCDVDAANDLSEVFAEV